jgi:hypothetical protein
MHAGKSTGLHAARMSQLRNRHPIAEHRIRIVWPRVGAVHFTEYLVNAPPAWVSEFGPSAA